MPRRPRADLEPGVHHIFARGNNREAIFVDDTDRHSYIRRLSGTIEEHGWRCLSYCLMTNHVHLLVETTEPNLAAGMRKLHGPYALGFNKRHGRTGHLFENRFGSARVDDDAYMWMVVAYIARNPVEAGLCSDPAQWPWSSHAAVLHERVPPPPWLDVPRLLHYMSALGGDPRTRYAQCVARR